MSDVKRYGFSSFMDEPATFDEDEDGEYVLASDHDATIARLTERVRELEAVLLGLISVYDSVTVNQQSERREEWLPQARALVEVKCLSAPTK